MGATAVILDPSATLTRITSLHDQISNTLSTSLGKWAFEYKLFRENPASAGSSSAVSPSSSFLYTLNFSQFPGDLFVLTNGTGVVMQGDFDSVLTTKLQSLWLPRQTIKAEGNAYQLQSGDFVFRTANLFLQGSFKGLVVQIEYTKECDDAEAVAKINEILANYELEYSNTKVGRTRMESAWQFVETISK